MGLGEQAVWLFLLAFPVAAVSWAVTHEEIFREARDFCQRCTRDLPRLWQRKFFFVFTCEYCFSHYVVIIFLAVTRFKLLYQDWRGYIIAGFALVWIANLYMGLFGHLRLDIRKERVEISEIQKETEEKEQPKRVA